MSLFKKKIKFVSFVKELIGGTFHAWESNCAVWIDMADEAHVLTDSEKRDILARVPELMVADIILSSDNHLGKKTTIEYVTLAAGMVYELYLRGLSAVRHYVEL